MTNNVPVDVQTAFERQQKGSLLVDVREKSEFDAGHAQGAISLPMSELNNRYQEIPQDQEILVICKSGGRSGQVCQALGQAQYNVTNVAGGSLDWYAENLPFVSETGSDAKVI